MNLNYIDEIKTNLQNVQVNGMDQQQQEAYECTLRCFTRLVGTIKEQKRILRDMADFANKTRNNELYNTFQMLSMQLGQAYEMMKDCEKILIDIVIDLYPDN